MVTKFVAKCSKTTQKSYIETELLIFLRNTSFWLALLNEKGPKVDISYVKLYIKRVLFFFVFLIGAGYAYFYSQSKTCFHENCYVNNFDQLEIKQSVIYLISSLKPMIIKVSRDYSIDPKILALVIATENSLNVNIDDAIQDYLAKYGVTSVLGKKFSYGIGQIKPDTAFAVDHIVAKLDQRPLRTEDEVAQSLTDVNESLKYAAAILYNAKKLYLEKGFDLTGNVSILATLYNVGKIEKRIKEIGEDHILRPNAFGNFAKRNIKTIEKIILDNDNKFSISLDKKFYKLNQLNSKVKSYFSPDFCEVIFDRRRFKPVKKVHKYFAKTLEPSKFKVIRTSFGCQFDRWSFLEIEDQGYAWVRNKELVQFASEVRLKPTSFRKTVTCAPKKINFERVSQRFPASVNSYFRNDCELLSGMSIEKCNLNYIKTVEKIKKSKERCERDALFVANKKLYHKMRNDEELSSFKIYFNDLESEQIVLFNSLKSGEIVEKLY